jgi:DNA-directed RNA polymerase alpha subunit
MLKYEMNPLFYKYDVSVRVANGLTRAGITTIAQLFKLHDENRLYTIMQTKGLGRKSYNEVRDLIEYLQTEREKDGEQLKTRI